MSSKPPDNSRLNKVVAESRKNREKRELSYREQALKLFPWVCGRCCREFDRSNLNELTIHHRNHDHDYNPPDGSNWELLCIYCHEDEHSRHVHASTNSQIPGNDDNSARQTHYHPFSSLGEMLKNK